MANKNRMDSDQHRLAGDHVRTVHVRGYVLPPTHRTGLSNLAFRDLYLY